MSETVTKIIEYVQPEIREWEGNDGKKMWFVTVNFDDDSQGSDVAFARAKAEEVQDIFRSLKGTPTEFTLEDGGEYQGTKKWKIKGYPGRPAGGGGGGGKGGGGMSHAQVGILAASNIVSGWLGASLKRSLPEGAVVNIVPSDGDVDLLVAQTIEIAERITEHLFTRRKDTGAEDASSGAASTPAPVTSAAPQNPITLAQIKRVKELATIRGIEHDVIASTIGVNALGDLSTEDAATLIESWEAAG